MPRPRREHAITSDRRPMSRRSIDRKRTWAAVLFVGILVSAGNYYLKLDLFGRYGIDVLFFILFMSLFSLAFMLRSPDQMAGRGSIDMERGGSSIRHIVRRRLVGLLGDSNFLKMALCLCLGIVWIKALAHWIPGMSTWIRIVVVLPTLLFVVAGFFFCMRGFWRMRQ